MTQPTKVLIVDDSAFMRKVLGAALSQDPSIQVVGTAGDPYEAREKIISLNPDVLTLDVEMPRMDGLTFLEKLMRGRPIPVVMVSTLTEAGSRVTLRALELGAVDYVAKPTVDIRKHMDAVSREVVEKVKVAAAARVRALPAEHARPVRCVVLPHKVSPRQLIAVGASTGGTEALMEFVADLPGGAPGIVIAQHMPAHFTKSFASRLDAASCSQIKEAADGDLVRPGVALLAPGSHHMRVVAHNGGYRVVLDASEKVNRFRPSVDVLFASVAEHARKNAVGVLMTGMGSDGARGLLQMKKAGAGTLCQDEKTCVVYGMPRAAVELGAASAVLPLPRLCGEAVRLSSLRPATSAT